MGVLGGGGCRAQMLETIYYYIQAQLIAARRVTYL